MQSKRFTEIDFLRGMAIIGMVVFHIFYVLNFYTIVQNEMHEGWFLLLARSVQFIFIGLVGVSLAISKQRRTLQGISNLEFFKRHSKRGLQVLLLGYLITLFTYLVVPERFVRFGILHLIGVGIMLFSSIADRKYTNLILGIFVLALSPIVKSLFIGSSSYIMYSIGLTGFGKGNAVDYFPLFPWLALIPIGVFLGNVFYKNFQRNFSLTIKIPKYLKQPICIMGRHSLLIYLIHVPIILTLFVICNIITLDLIFSA